MSQPVMKRAIPDGSEQYYRSDWRLMIETHLVWLIANARAENLILDPHLGYKYEGDFYGLLTEAKIPRQLHYLVMRMNKMYNPTEYTGTLTSLVLPDENLLSTLSSIFQTSNKKIT